MFGTDFGIDFGTANTLIYVKGKGIALNEPTLAIADVDTRELMAFGRVAKSITENVSEKVFVLRPVKDGVIADFETASRILERFLKTVSKKGLFRSRPKVIFNMPLNATEVEKKAAAEALILAGASPKDIYMVKSPLAAALGAGLDIKSAEGKMVLDIGAGLSQAAVISLGSIIRGKSIKVGGGAFNETVSNFIAKSCNLSIGIGMAEKIKRYAGDLYPKRDEIFSVKGICLGAEKGIPKVEKMEKKALSEALRKTASLISDMAEEVLFSAPNELREDIEKRGLILTGGGSLLKGMDLFLKDRLGIPVTLAESPLECAALGCGRLLDAPEKMKQVIHS